MNQNENVTGNDNPSTLSSMKCNPSLTNTTINRGERHPIMDQSIAIDNNTLNSIINSILQTKNDNGKDIKNDPAAAPTPAPIKEGTATATGTTTTETSSIGESQQYLLPVDLLISVDGAQHATVKAALPSAFAFQQPMISTLPYNLLQPRHYHPCRWYLM